MTIQVVVLGERSIELFSRWSLRDSCDERSLHWRDLALGLVQKARRGRSGLAEVFLCLPENHWELYDPPFLKDLVRQAKRATFGSRVYAVVDRSEPVLLDPHETPDFFHQWFDGLRSSGIDDLLQMVDPLGFDPQDSLMLRSITERARTRRSLLGPEGGWTAALENPEGELGTFLSPLVRYSPVDTAGQDLVLVLEPGFHSQKRVAELLREAYQPERAIVALLTSEPESDLTEYCQRESLSLLRFRGRLELRYYLLQLHHGTAVSKNCAAIAEGRTARKHNRSEDHLARYEAGLEHLLRELSGDHPRIEEAWTYQQRLTENLQKERQTGSTEILRSERAEILRSLNRLSLATRDVSFDVLCQPRGGPVSGAGSSEPYQTREPTPALILTHTFHPDTDAELCLTASRLAAGMRQDLGPNVRFEVLLAATLDSLGAIMGHMTGPALWVYLGISDDLSGLHEASGRCVPVSDWLTCFRDLGRDLVAALIVAPNSGNAAEALVRHGIPCAVGCARNREQSELFLRPARELLRWLLHNSIDCSALRDRLADLGSEYGCRYVAYCAESG